MDSIQLFKALGDKSRLRIVNTLRIEGPMYVELLSQRLELAQSTVSFHLKKLEECGIVKSNKEQYYVVFSLNTELLESKVIDLISNTNSDLDEQKEREIKYRNEVLKSYFKNGRLTSIPVQKDYIRIYSTRFGCRRIIYYRSLKLHFIQIYYGYRKAKRGIDSKFLSI